ncbi:histidine kinase [Thiomicrorhabdus immobilis]|uniref:Histidine kinase n=1 Tax=Thiomicrorhabdus immobilis TaxID=2791037 RepID=A0ABN6CVL6_9GAMM|nr:FIST N-terminal domain-containing protein [Thiomicrorhabdus immobilis]BCN93086.1 histidine kinase [Thiomicrorhabdus immobilis]
MEIESLELKNNVFQILQPHQSENFSPQIVFLFGDTDFFKKPEYYQKIRECYPDADIIGSSSSGNVMGVEVSQSPIIALAVQFKKARVKLVSIDFQNNYDLNVLEEQVTQAIAELDQPDLKQLFVLSDGLTMNGSDLVGCINKVTDVPVTGGLAGDGARFQETWVMANDVPKQNRVAILGFYGDSLKTSYGCYAGWSEFGAERYITKSDRNVVYEIDNQPALDLYKKYLGDYAADLPNSGLRFPLSIKKEGDDSEIIRTLLAINEEDKSITFAGNVPEGYRARLMKPDLDVLIDGAGIAAQNVEQANNSQALGLVVSCVGRKIIMGQMVEEELEAVEEILGNNVQLCGFYSYGEISPMNIDGSACSLHNQTMTLTTIYEDI